MVFLIILAVEVLKIVDGKKYDELRDYVENNGQLDNNNVDHKIIFDLLKTVKTSPNDQELNEIFKEIIGNKYI